MKLKWYQFSVRSLLILVTLFAVASSWFALKRKQALHQKEIVDQIKKDGGSVSYVYPHPFGMSVPEWLRDSCGEDFFGNVESVLRANDSDLERIKEFSQIRYLYLAGTSVSNAGLGNIRDLSHLRELALDQTNIGDDGLECLQGLKELRLLLVSWTKISDAGLKHLEGLAELETLDLRGTKITGEGLMHLRGNAKLRHLLLVPEMLDANNVTEESIRAIKKYLPNLRIVVCTGRHDLPEPEYEEWREDRNRK